MSFQDDIDRAVGAADFGRASAVKRGRDARWPYVPLNVWTEHDGVERTTQILGKAFATRAEAVQCAQSHIAGQRVLLRTQLAEPRHRALREQHGLPREIPAEVS